jgi:membrane protease YdiL (CAAX protease family)
MHQKFDSKRVWIFLLIAFGIAWVIDLAIYMTGGLTDFSVFSLAGGLMVVSMFAPSMAHILTRLFTKEGWKGLKLRLHFKQGKSFWFLAWFLTPMLAILGMGIYFIIFPQYFDPTFAAAGKVLAQTAQRTGKPVPVTPVMLVLIQTIQVILLAPILNGLATFGEEFGWRAYLLQKLMPLGGRKAMLVLGVVWGLWHWPIIFMGFEYGLSYPGYPWLGPLVMLWFTFIISIFFSWLTIKSKSVWPAVIAHASLNGIAAIAAFFTKGQPNTLLGPALAGLLASLPFAVMAVWLLLRSSVFSHIEPVAESQPAETVTSQAGS